MKFNKMELKINERTKKILINQIKRKELPQSEAYKILSGKIK